MKCWLQDATPVCALVILSACSSVVDLDPVPIDDETASTLLIVEHENGVALFGAAGFGESPQRHQIEEQGPLTVWAILYQQPLVLLGLPEGALHSALPDEPFIHVPEPFHAVYRATVEGTTASDFKPVETLSDTVRQIRIRVPPALDCLQKGGCHLGDSDACTVPCPDPELPTTPDTAELPNFLPCPTGWYEQQEGDLTLCDPWPAGGAKICDLDEVHLPGSPGCERIGPRCSADGWAEDLPTIAHNILYVRAGAAPNGDGTKTAPFYRIRDAIVASTPGFIVAVAEGTYQAPVSIYRDDITIWGACVENTLIVVSGTSYAVTARASDGVLKNVTVSGGDRAGIRVDRDDELTLENVIVEATEDGISALGDLTGSDILVRDVSGAGLSVENGTTVLSRVHIAGFWDRGVEVTGANTTVDLSDCAIRTGTDHQAFGVRAAEEAFLSMRRCVVEDVSYIGLLSNNAEVVLSDVAIMDTAPDDTHNQGAGIIANAGSQFSGARVSVQSSVAFGVTVEEGALLQVDDLLIREVRSKPSTSGGGIGLLVNDSEVELNRTVVDAARMKGVTLQVGAKGTLNDLTVRDTMGDDNGDYGVGVEVREESSLTGSRIHVERSYGRGFLALNAGTSVELTDVTIRETFPRRSNGAFGRGLELNSAAQGTIERLRVLDSKSIGVHATDLATKLVITDAYVAGTEESGCFEYTCATTLADGMGANLSGALEVDRFLVEDNAHFGVRATHPFLVLKNGMIRNNPVGVLIETLDFDFSAISNRVRLENDENVSVTPK